MKLQVGKENYPISEEIFEIVRCVFHTDEITLVLIQIKPETISALKNQSRIAGVPDGKIIGRPMYFATTPEEILFYPAPDKEYQAELTYTVLRRM